jgi:hypothetical protein
MPRPIISDTLQRRSSNRHNPWPQPQPLRNTTNIPRSTTPTATNLKINKNLKDFLTNGAKNLRTCTLAASVQCPICPDAYTDENGAIKIRRCAHIFHLGCLSEWIHTKEQLSSSTCPMCRAPLFARKEVEGCYRTRRGGGGPQELEWVTGEQLTRQLLEVMEAEYAVNGRAYDPLVDDRLDDEIHALMGASSSDIVIEEDPAVLEMRNLARNFNRPTAYTTFPPSPPPSHTSPPVPNSYINPPITPPSSPHYTLNPPSPLITNSWIAPTRDSSQCTFALLRHSLPGAQIEYYTSEAFNRKIPPGSEAEQMWYRGEIAVWVAVPPGFSGSTVVRGGWRFEVVEDHLDRLVDPVL